MCRLIKIKIKLLFLTWFLFSVKSNKYISKRRIHKTSIIPIHHRIKFLETDDETFLDIEDEYVVISPYSRTSHIYYDSSRIGELPSSDTSLTQSLSGTILSLVQIFVSSISNTIFRVSNFFNPSNQDKTSVSTLSSEITLSDRQGISGSTGFAVLAVATTALATAIQQPLRSAIASVDLSNTPFGDLTNTPISQLQSFIVASLVGK